MKNGILNSKNIKTSDSCRLIFNLADKINSKRSDKCINVSNINI